MKLPRRLPSDSVVLTSLKLQKAFFGGGLTSDVAQHETTAHFEKLGFSFRSRSWMTSVIAATSETVSLCTKQVQNGGKA